MRTPYEDFLAQHGNEGLRRHFAQRVADEQLHLLFNAQAAAPIIRGLSQEVPLFSSEHLTPDFKGPTIDGKCRVLDVKELPLP